MALRVASISSSRADVGALLPVWRALTERGVTLDVLLTGMHQAAGDAVQEGIPQDAAVHRCGADLGGAATGGAAAMGSIVTECGRLYEALRPDLVLVMGDRLDMLPAAAAALPANLPLAHLHGGELTEGAIDDRIRHALTKLAHLHLVSCAGAKERVRGLGEEPWRIVETGAPGLDTLLAAPDMPQADFLQAVGLGVIAGAQEGFRLVTVHPETNAPDSLAPLRAVLAALDQSPMPTLFTAPNSDPGGARMKEMISGFVAARPWAIGVDTLGPTFYPNALRQARLMLGNSSSGILEAGLFGVPVIDVGDRQKGRERGRNVCQVPNDAAAIHMAEVAILRSPERIIDCPYGDGKAGPRAAEAMLAFHGEPRTRRLTKRATTP